MSVPSQVVSVLTAEEERLQQAPVQEDAGAEFGRAMQQSHQTHGSKKYGASNGQSGPVKAASDGTHKHPSNGHSSSHLSATSTSQPKRAHTAKAASPTASASPQHSSYKIPFPHAQAVFHPQSIYLHANSSPNQLDGLSAEDEIRLRAHTCVFMSKVGAAMNIGQLAVATASVYLQVFYTHYSFKAFDRFEIACTCLFLAGKVEEKKIRIDHVIAAYYPQRQVFDKEIAAAKGEQYLPKNIPATESSEWDEFRNKMYDHETVLLDAIEYQFDIVHPYAFLRKFIENYIYSPLYANESESFIANQLRSNGLMAQIAWNFINDSLRTTLCLRYAPSTICVVAIRLAMRHLISNKLLETEPTKFGAAKDALAKPWHEELFGLNKQTMKKMQEEIINCIEFVGPDYNKLVLEAHTKSRSRSNVPLPNVKNQIKMLHELQRRQASAKHQAQFAASKPNAESKDDKTTASTSSSHHSDRKRHRSSDRSQRKDDSRHSHSSSTRPAMSPLPCPPSPFLDATAPNPKSWVPDMRPNRSSSSHHRSDRDRDRHRDRDRDRARDRDRRDHKENPDHKSGEKRHRSRSRSRRSRSRSQRRASKEKVSVDGKNEATFVHDGAAASAAHDFRDTSSFASDPSHLSTIREESDSQSINSSKFHSHRSTSSVSASLTKSASSLSLNMHMPHTSSSRLHTSASMNYLSRHGSSNGNIDILAGDILHMSSSHGPSGTLTEKSEEDIMRDINRESRSLKQEKREDSAEVDESEERASKRQRLDVSHSASASADFDDLNVSTDTLMASADTNIGNNVTSTASITPATHHHRSHSSAHESHALVSMQSNVSTTCVADAVEMKVSEPSCNLEANPLADSVMSQPTSDKAQDIMRTDSLEQKSAAMETMN